MIHKRDYGKENILSFREPILIATSSLAKKYPGVEAPVTDMLNAVEKVLEGEGEDCRIKSLRPGTMEELRSILSTD
jgi:hypothetical protein